MLKLTLTVRDHVFSFSFICMTHTPISKIFFMFLKEVSSANQGCFIW